MTKATAAILASLNEVFAPLDAEVLAGSVVWAKGRCAAIKEFKASEEVATRRANAKSFMNFSAWYYDRLFAIAGGKTWHNVFQYGFNARVEEFVTKNCAATVALRNAKITRKLEKAGVTEVVSSDFARSKDGFNGTFTVETNTGRKVVTVNTIRAGGYNIQCLHLRVLVKVK